jgi:hypothetical protein
VVYQEDTKPCPSLPNSFLECKLPHAKGQKSLSLCFEVIWFPRAYTFLGYHQLLLVVIVSIQVLIQHFRLPPPLACRWQLMCSPDLADCGHRETHQKKLCPLYISLSAGRVTTRRCPQGVLGENSSPYFVGLSSLLFSAWPASFPMSSSLIQPCSGEEDTAIAVLS